MTINNSIIIPVIRNIAHLSIKQIILCYCNIIYAAFYQQYTQFLEQATFLISIISKDNLKQQSHLKFLYLKMGSCTHDFHYSIEKSSGKEGRYVSFNEIHVLYMHVEFSTLVQGIINIEGGKMLNLNDLVR